MKTVDKLKKIAEEKMEIFGADELKKMAGVGMSKVDPLDIRPPRYLLVQSSSNLGDMADKKGSTPKPGQFYHTGTKKIVDKFTCYVLFAAKGVWEDRRKEPVEKKEAYNALMALKDDLSLFAMSFRSSALYTLSGLFTAVQSQHRPIFSFEVNFESKKLESEGNQWYIPVARVGELVNGKGLLDELYSMSVGFEKNADKVKEEIEKEEE